jgi:phosphoglycolate phosphatase
MKKKFEQVRNLLFDLDGTLVDSSETIRTCVRYALDGLDPARSLMIGDRAQDISGARDNGLLAVAVTYGFGAGAELDAARPDHMVDHSLELLELLDAH